MPWAQTYKKTRKLFELEMCGHCPVHLWVVGSSCMSLSFQFPTSSAANFNFLAISYYYPQLLKYSKDCLKHNNRKFAKECQFTWRSQIILLSLFVGTITDNSSAHLYYLGPFRIVFVFHVLNLKKQHKKRFEISPQDQRSNHLHQQQQPKIKSWSNLNLNVWHCVSLLPTHPPHLCVWTCLNT